MNTDIQTFTVALSKHAVAYMTLAADYHERTIEAFIADSAVAGACCLLEGGDAYQKDENALRERMVALNMHPPASNGFNAILSPAQRQLFDILAEEAGSTRNEIILALACRSLEMHPILDTKYPRHELQLNLWIYVAKGLTPTDDELERWNVTLAPPAATSSALEPVAT